MPEITISLGDHEVQTFVTDKDLITIGRAKNSDILIENLSVSRNHARIHRDEQNRYYIEDLNSSNGTRVNSKRVTRSEVFNNDVILIGKHRLCFKGGDSVPMVAVNNDIDATMMLDASLRQSDVYLYGQCGKLRPSTLSVVKESTRIGRGDANELHLADWFIDSHQAEIVRDGDDYLLINRSKNFPTLLNGSPTEDTPLRQGDVIQAGMTRILFSFEEIIPKTVSSAFMSQPLRSLIPKDEEEQDSDFEELETVDMEKHQQQLAALEESEEAAEQEENQEDAEQEENQNETSELSMETVGDEIISQEQQAVHEEDDEEFANRETANYEDFAEELEADQAGQQQQTEEPDEISDEDVESVEVESEPESSSDPSEDSERIATLEKALENSSPVVRKIAAKQLKALTGRDYDY